MTTFATWLVSLLPAPVARRWGEAWATAHGQALDWMERRANDAVVSRGLADAPDDALPYHGADRQIPRLPEEDAGNWRSRLVGAWETWIWATTGRSLRDAAVHSRLGTPQLLTQAEYPRAPHPDIYWARFTVLFHGRLAWDGLADWDSLGFWGERSFDPIESMAPLRVRRSMESLLQTWKSARDRVTSVVITRGSRLWDLGDEAWDDADVVWDEGGTVTELFSECFDEDLVWDTPGDLGGYFDWFQ